MFPTVLALNLSSPFKHSNSTLLTHVLQDTSAYFIETSNTIVQKNFPSFLSQNLFSSCTTENKVYLGSLFLFFPRERALLIKGFHFPLSTAFSPHLCLKACCMSQNSFVPSSRIQFEYTLTRKGDFTPRHHRCLKKCNGRNAMVLNLNENCKAIGLLSTLLFSSRFVSFFSCTLASCGFTFGWQNPNFERERTLNF